MAAKIHLLVNSCRECPEAQYESGGRYACRKAHVMFEGEGLPTTLPVWCPLPDHPGASIQALERQLVLALRQWEAWKGYSLELQKRLLKHEGGSPMILNSPKD